MNYLTGIWIDTHQAIIVKIMDDEVSISKVTSAVEDYHIKGGYGGKTPYAPQQAVSETTLQERKNHQLNEFYNEIIERIEFSKGIYILGPGIVKKGLSKQIEADNNLKDKLFAVDTSDKLTDNQLKAKVKDFFKHHAN